MRPSGALEIKAALPTRAWAIAREAVWFLFISLICGHFAMVYTWRSKSLLEIEKYAAGTDFLPYQARILTAWIYHVLLPLPLLRWLAGPFPPDLQPPVQMATMIVTLISLLVTVLATRQSIHLLTGDKGFARWACLLVLWMSYFNLVTPYGLTYRLPYDGPSLALFSLGLLIVLREWRWLLFPMMVIGTLNRETFCFVTVFFVVWEWERLRELKPVQRARKILPAATLQLVLWMVVKLWLKHHFAGNPVEGSKTGLFDLHLKLNIDCLHNRIQWPLLASICGFSWIPILVWNKWIVHRGIRLATLVIFPLWFLIMMVVGVIIEIRVFNEMSALLTLAAAVALHARWKTSEIYA